MLNYFFVSDAQIDQEHQNKTILSIEENNINDGADESPPSPIDKLLELDIEIEKNETDKLIGLLKFFNFFSAFYYKKINFQF